MCDPGLGPGQAGGGASVLLGQDRRDGLVVVVRGQPPHQVHGVLAGGRGVAAFLGHRHGQFGYRAALPDDPQVRDAVLGRGW